MSIQVFNNFLTEEETQNLYNYAQYSKNWRFQDSKELKESESLLSSGFLFLEIPESKTFFHKTIFERIKKLINEKVFLHRVYINGQSTGCNGTFHIDGCDKTVLIYLSPYNIEWGGFTEFILNENGDHPEIKCVAPFTSSMVIFDGDIPHKGYSYSYQHCPIRYSLAYKLNYKPNLTYS